MTNPRGTARIAILLDLAVLVACLVTLGNALAMNLASAGIGALPKHADARVLALDLYQAQRQAVRSGEVVTVEFTRQPNQPLTAYRVSYTPPLRIAYDFRSGAFDFRADVTSSSDHITFDAAGHPSEPLSVFFPTDRAHRELRVSTQGEIRILSADLAVESAQATAASP